MIEYSVNTDQTLDRNLMYFAGDGSWGSADDIAVVDVTELDGHFVEFIDEVNEWQRPDYVRWFVENQTHDQAPHSYTACRVCEHWNEEMTEDEIIEYLENEEDNA